MLKKTFLLAALMGGMMFAFGSGCSVAEQWVGFLAALAVLGGVAASQKTST